MASTDPIKLPDQPSDPALFAPLTLDENSILHAHLTSGWYKQSAVYPALSGPWQETRTTWPSCRRPQGRSGEAGPPRGEARAGRAGPEAGHTSFPDDSEAEVRYPLSGRAGGRGPRGVAVAARPGRSAMCPRRMADLVQDPERAIPHEDGRRPIRWASGIPPKPPG